MNNCYDCKNCVYKPQDYGETGVCAVRGEDGSSKHTGLPFEPLNATYADHEEALGAFPSFAKSCPDFGLGERQKLCKELKELQNEIAAKMEQWDMMLEGIQDYDFENQKQFGDFAWGWFQNVEPIDSSVIKATENPNRVWKALGRRVEMF